MLTENEKDAAERAILEYLTDHNAWERAAWKLAHSRKAETDWADVRASLQSGYDALLRRHCAPRVIALGLLYAFGNPPAANPAGLRIVSITRKRGVIKALTEERDRDGLVAETTYEYELIELDGDLKLSERRARFADRRPIREVW